MRESEQCIETAARHGAPLEQLVAGRILESPAIWTRWENEHATLMRSVGEQRRSSNQITALKAACFSLIHRKALFEHLRDQQVRGQARRQILQYFHRTCGYTHAAIAEHEIYLRSACSYLCSGQVGGEVIQDGVFQYPMQRYEALYREYFRLFCEAFLTEETDTSSSRALLPYLRFQLAEQRHAVIAMPRMTAAMVREAELRAPTGDTVQLRVDQLRRRFDASAANRGDKGKPAENLFGRA